MSWSLTERQVACTMGPMTDSACLQHRMIHGKSAADCEKTKAAGTTGRLQHKSTIEELKMNRTCQGQFAAFNKVYSAAY